MEFGNMSHPVTVMGGNRSPIRITGSDLEISILRHLKMSIKNPKKLSFEEYFDVLKKHLESSHKNGVSILKDDVENALIVLEQEGLISVSSTLDETVGWKIEYVRKINREGLQLLRTILITR